MRGIYDYLKTNNEEVLFCDRSGNIISVYLKNDIKIIFEFKSIEIATRKLTIFRRELENKKVG